MIVPIFGCPGSGKSTLGDRLAKNFGYPFFELSWMPEFRIMNGKKISYEEEEKIAVSALLGVAKTYCEYGHKIVLVSDFRLNSLDLVMNSIGIATPVIKLIASDDDILRTRVINNSRSSFYRNAEEALHLNEKISIANFENQISIDVTKSSLETEIKLVLEFVNSFQNI